MRFIFILLILGLTTDATAKISQKIHATPIKKNFFDKSQIRQVKELERKAKYYSDSGKYLETLKLRKKIYTEQFIN
jgi:hypothetical protein